MSALRRLLRGERGEMSATGLIVSVTLSFVVCSASLGLYETFASRASANLRRNDVQDVARRAADELARDLRNLAAPSSAGGASAIGRATGYDLVFTAVDPVGPNAGANSGNVQRKRWCLDGPSDAATLYEQTQSWTQASAPAMPADTACPAPTSSGWTTQRAVATGITNRRDGLDRPLFVYDTAAGGAVTGVHVDLLVDDDLVREPPEVRLGTGVFLRNQNRAPVAAFTATKTAQGVVLNGSASADPEGQPLTFTWLDGASAVAGCSSITCTYRVTAGTSHALKLRVTDPSGLTGDSAVQAVTG